MIPILYILNNDTTLTELKLCSGQSHDIFASEDEETSKCVSFLTFFFSSKQNFDTFIQQKQLFRVPGIFCQSIKIYKT